MKKLVATIVMIIFITCNPVLAFTPLAIPAVAIGAGALVGAAIQLAGLYFYLSPGASSSVSSSGDITRPTNATWIDLTAVPPQTMTANLHSKMSNSQLRQIASKIDSNNQPLYPLVKSTMEKSTLLPLPTSHKPGVQIGSIYSTPKGTVQVDSYTGSYTWDNGYPQTTGFFPGAFQGNLMIGFSMVFRDGATGTQYTQKSYKCHVTTPPIIPTTPAEQAVRLSATGATPDNVNSAYQTELDKMFKDPDYVPVFSDDTTGLPFSPPSNVATPSQVASYNANGVAQEAKESAAASSQNAASSAGTAATTAANNYAASGGDPQTGVGGDPVLLQKMRDAQASAAAAQAAADKLKADQAADDALEPPGLPGDNAYDSSVTAPDKKNITELLTSFAAGSPLISMVQSFTVTTSDSSGVVPIGNIYGQELSFDFTRWESILRTCGGVLILIMHGYAVLIVVRGW